MPYTDKAKQRASAKAWYEKRKTDPKWVEASRAKARVKSLAAYHADKGAGVARRREWQRKNPVSKMLSQARQSAKTKGISFNLELSDIQIPDICPVLSIPLCYDWDGPRKRNTASLDKIDPNKGYVKGNVWVISWEANRLKLNNTLETLRLLVAALEARGQQW